MHIMYDSAVAWMQTTGNMVLWFTDIMPKFELNTVFYEWLDASNARIMGGRLSPRSRRHGSS